MALDSCLMAGRVSGIGTEGCDALTGTFPLELVCEGPAMVAVIVEAGLDDEDEGGTTTALFEALGPGRRIGDFLVTTLLSTAPRCASRSSM